MKENPLDIYPLRVYNVLNRSFEFIIIRGCIMDKTESCQHKIKVREDYEVKSLVHRLNRIEGQVKGIRKMVEENAYCTDILIQVSAVKAALDSFNKVLLESHIRTCVVTDIRNGNDEVIDDLVATLQKLMK